MLIALVNLIHAQAPNKFYTRFGGFGHDIGYGIIQTFSGQYAVTGSTSSFGNGNTDVYLALVDSMGWVRWEKSYGGFNNDIGKSIIQLKDSGFVIAGYTNSFGSGGYDVFVVRTDKSGALIWQKTFGGMDWDFGYCVKEANGGDSLIICGNTYSYGYGKSDGYIIKTDINGNYQWQKTYGGPEDDEFKSFVLTYNNLYAFAGTTKSQGDVKGDCWIMKTSLNGDSVQNIKYGDNRKQNVNKIAEHPVTKNFYLCGGHDQYGKDSTSVYLLGLSETGSFLFDDFHTYHKLADEQYTGLVHSRNSDFVYIRKNAYSSSGNRKLEPMISSFADNIYLNVTSYGSLEDEELFDIIKTKKKGFCMVGYTRGFNANLSDIYLIVVDSISMTGANGLIDIGVKESETKYTPKAIVFPSVSPDFVTVGLSNESKSSFDIIVYNMLGEIVSELNTNQSIRINISPYPAGTYIIHCKGSDSPAQNFKIIKTTN